MCTLNIQLYCDITLPLQRKGSIKILCTRQAHDDFVWHWLETVSVPVNFDHELHIKVMIAYLPAAHHALNELTMDGMPTAYANLGIQRTNRPSATHTHTSVT